MLSASGLAQVKPQNDPALEARYRAAVGTFFAQNYEAALREFEALARNGYSEAAYFLNIMYDVGQGVPKDAQASIEWRRVAAELGNAKAQNALAGC